MVVIGYTGCKDKVVREPCLPVGWTLVETVNTLEKVNCHWNFVVIKFLLTGCHLDVHFVRNVSFQKRGVVVKLPVLQAVLRRDRQHRPNAPESEDGGECVATVDAGQLPPPKHNDSCLARVVVLDLVHPSAA